MCLTFVVNETGPIMNAREFINYELEFDLNNSYIHFKRKEDLGVHKDLIKLLHTHSSILLRCMMTFVSCVFSTFIYINFIFVNSKTTYVVEIVCAIPDKC